MPMQLHIVAWGPGCGTAQVDVVLLEVGIGGRYDATNIVRLQHLTTLTSCAFHCQ